MSNQSNSMQDILVKVYSVKDMHDLASLAECNMQWMNTAIEHVKKELKKLLDECVVPGHQLSELMTHLDMYEYIALSRLDHYSDKAMEYGAEIDANKKAEPL